ncbi:hypothetical protein PRZ48_010475 [Zasmidium cellare]|uniref:Uncharacterized protein n=1 Tax=Zasmidium cellare TaxID=395010 RepID=A0ABR0E8S9_ZASCE|nr:hypothetical protein PRZ48_010475 [Zasmidium cellare]
MSSPPNHVKFILAETHFYNPITPTSQLPQHSRVQTKKLQKKCRRPKGGAAEHYELLSKCGPMRDSLKPLVETMAQLLWMR